jgi:hypothetical protein
MKVTEWAALTGMATGVSAITLSIANYFRDRPRVRLTLQWDMKVLQNPQYDPSKLWGLVTVTNTGRRPVYISHIRLRLPKGAPSRFLLLHQGIGGEKLDEGGQPRPYMVDQSEFGKYAPYWRKIYAEASDSTGKTWKSKPPNRALGPPSWAKTE